MNKQKRLNELKQKKEKLLTILLSNKKFTKQNKKYMSLTLLTPLALIFLSFIMHCILSSMYTYWLLLSSLIVYIPAAIINVSIQLFGGYKMLLEKRLKNIQSKIEKIESVVRQKNKSIVKSEQKKTWDDVLYTEEEIKQYMKMPESPAPFNPETIFKTNELVEENNDSINDGIDGMPFPEEDDFINDGIDGMPFPNSYGEYGNSNSSVKNKVPILTKKLTLPKHTGKNK